MTLRAEGIRTLRFSNLDVLKETEGVAEVIWEEVRRLLADLQDSTARSRDESGPPVTPPSPSLSPEGSGERGESGAQGREACLHDGTM